jgi:hypothetical protein
MALFLVPATLLNSSSPSLKLSLSLSPSLSFISTIILGLLISFLEVKERCVDVTVEYPVPPNGSFPIGVVVVCRKFGFIFGVEKAYFNIF